MDVPVFTKQDVLTPGSKRAIARWPITDAKALVRWVISGWQRGDELVAKNARAEAWYVATGRLKRNEALVAALLEADAFESAYDWVSIRGGAYVFVHRNHPDIMDAIMTSLVQLAVGTVPCVRCGKALDEDEIAFSRALPVIEGFCHECWEDELARQRLKRGDQ